MKKGKNESKVEKFNFQNNFKVFNVFIWKDSNNIEYEIWKNRKNNIYLNDIYNFKKKIFEKKKF